MPKVRMDEATGELKDRIRQLEARLDAAPREKPADQPKRWTRAELNAAVEARQITQDQADDVLDRQIREAAKLASKAEGQARPAVEKRPDDKRSPTGKAVS